MARSKPAPTEAGPPPSTQRRRHPTSLELPDDIDDDHRFVVLYGLDYRLDPAGRKCTEGGGERPPLWFFVPDTGVPGGSAILTGPTGQHLCIESQTTAHLADTMPADDALERGVLRDWPDGTRAPALGFMAPAVFNEPGAYVLTVTQEDRVDTYGITVLHEPEMDIKAEEVPS